MYGAIIDWPGRSAGLTLEDLLDESYLDAPSEAMPRQAPAAPREAHATRLRLARPDLRDLLD